MKTTPADRVIEAFGGIRPLARAISRNPSSVLRWRRPKSEGGTGGSVPTAMQGRVLAVARARGIALEVADVVMTEGDCEGVV